MRKQKWLRWILALAILALAASVIFSRALRSNAARRYLIARLVASFGRPVEVARFDFSLLDGARIEAHSVTVAEDPHFGNEYFLRAETLTAALRWPALISGRIEFGTLTLLRPSLNLVRDAEGHWNIERWLPPAQPGASRPGFVGPLADPRGVRAALLYRIDVDGGRINFKQRDDKSPFALLDVSGRVEQDSAGRWRLDIEARPMRAGVELQDIGTVGVRGTIAGTSARLQPAELNLTWRAASLADALRLARQQDYGMRGTLDVDLSARVASPESISNQVAVPGGAQWSISAVARLTGIHGWRLPGRATDPAANLFLEAGWRLGESRVEIQKLLVEMTKSHVQGAGDLDWTHGFRPQLHVESSSVNLEDALSWYRAIRPGVAEDLHADGALSVDLTLGAWPPQLQQGTIVSPGASLTAASLPAPLEIGALKASVARGGLDISPTEISFSTPVPERVSAKASTGDTSSNSFVFSGSLLPENIDIFRLPLNWNLAIQGGTPHAQDWLLLSEKLAHRLNDGWSAAGGFAVNMHGVHRVVSPATVWLGTMDFRDLILSPAYVNQPIRLPAAHLEYAPAKRTITLSATQALGATWNGAITRKNSDKLWTFDLSADQLDAAELDRWLGPRARPGFLARFAGFGSSDSDPPQTSTFVEQLAARGRLRVNEFAVASLRFERFDGDVEIAGRTIDIHKAQADFFDGNISGTLDAWLLADPSYEFHGRFDRVNLAQLARAVPFLNDRIAGLASATLSLSAHGIGRQNLISSMEGIGTLNARNAEILGLDLTGIYSDDRGDPSSNPFASIQGTFHIHDAGIDLADFLLDNSRGRLRAEGRIDFSHALNVRIQPSIFQAATSLDSASPSSFVLNGTIEDPRLVHPPSAVTPASRSGVRGR